jgi:predicted metal-dependent hydrolase
MNDPKELKIIEQFPDDLKGMLRDLKVPLDDPVISLLAWIWKQMNETRETIDNAKMTVTAVLQERLDKMRQTADLLISTNGHLKEIDEQIRARPLNIKEQVQNELAIPIKLAADSCQQLDDQVRSVINRLDSKLGKTQRRLNIAMFASGFLGGGLTIACLFHLLPTL